MFFYFDISKSWKVLVVDLMVEKYNQQSNEKIYIFVSQLQWKGQCGESDIVCVFCIFCVCLSFYLGPSLVLHILLYSFFYFKSFYVWLILLFQE